MTIARSKITLLPCCLCHNQTLASNATEMRPAIDDLIVLKVLLVDLPDYGAEEQKFEGRCDNLVQSIDIEVLYADIGEQIFSLTESINYRLIMCGSRTKAT